MSTNQKTPWVNSAAVAAVYQTNVPMTPTTLLVAARLAAYANDDWQAWPGEPRLAADCRVSVRTVRRALAFCVRAGVVTRVTRGNSRHAAVYEVNRTPVSGSEASTGHGCPVQVSQPDTDVRLTTSAAKSAAKPGCEPDTGVRLSVVNRTNATREPDTGGRPTIQEQTKNKLALETHAAAIAGNGVRIWLEGFGLNRAEAERVALDCHGLEPSRLATCAVVAEKRHPREKRQRVRLFRQMLRMAADSGRESTQNTAAM